MKRLCLLAILLLRAWSPARSEEILTTVAQVRALPVEQARQSLPVRVHGVITFYDPEWNLAFLQDQTGGIFLRLRGVEDAAPYPAPGDEVEIEGVTLGGLFAPIIGGPGDTSAVLRILGKGRLPAAAPLTGAQLAEPDRDCQWVEVRGVIRAMDPVSARPTLELDIDGRPVMAHFRPRTNLQDLAPGLLGVPVRVRGVAATAFNNFRQMTGRILYLPGLDCIELESAPLMEDPFGLPLQPFDSLLRATGQLQDRVRVRGVVTAPARGVGMYLRGEGGGLWVQTARRDATAPGDVVEVVGWPEMAHFKPVLRAALFRQAGHEAAPAPLPITAAEALDGTHHCDFVSVEGTLAGQEQSADSVRLILRAGGTFFEARVPNSEELTRLRDIPVGSRLRVAGICWVTPPARFKTPQVGQRFEVRASTLRDVSVLERASWWNVQRLLWLFGGTSALAGGVLAWAVLLRRQVRAQTEVIRVQLERQTVLQERQRIARELHDTLEQELAGVSMQLDNTARHFETAPKAARAALQSAQRMLRHSRAESRSSIRDLRSLTLETRGLPAALDELLRPLAEAAGAKFELHVLGVPSRLSATTETHLLRLAHEAVANAARHAHASEISVTLSYLTETAELLVRDNGIGFDVATRCAGRDHFGLLGMEERADQLGGELTVESIIGIGTRVQVAAPHSQSLEIHG